MGRSQIRALYDAVFLTSAVVGLVVLSSLARSEVKTTTYVEPAEIASHDIRDRSTRRHESLTNTRPPAAPAFIQPKKASNSSPVTAPAFLFEAATHQDGLDDDTLAERQRDLIAYLNARAAIPARGGATRATIRVLRALRRGDGVVRVDGRSLQRKDFGHLLNRLGLAHGGKGVEIGVSKGKNCEQLRKAWRGASLHCIDPCPWLRILQNT